MRAMTVLGVAAAALVVALVATGLATAAPWQRGDLHEIIEEGTFADLQQYREQAGFQAMPWVDSAEDFETMQEHHEQMESWHEENGVAPGYGMGRGMGGMMNGMMGGGMMGSYGGMIGRGTIGGSGGCPMHQ